jgi:Protein ENHANCED DISEASE RESISTANCE 2, C-terminal
MLGTIPASILSNEYWADLDASTFRVRGKKYIDDKVKVVPAPSIFKLIAIDV